MMGELTAKDIMKREVIVVRGNLTVRELATLFTDQAISGAPVEGDDGNLVGVVSVTDIVRSASEGGEDLLHSAGHGFFVHGWEEQVDLDELDDLHLEEEGLLVKDIMTPMVFAVDQSSSISHVARTLLESHLHRILVVDNEMVVGIISTSDMMQVLVGSVSPASGKIAFEVTTELTFADAVSRCRELLAGEGFGVLSEIDVQATLKKKLDLDTEPYLILGACHPPSAFRALSTLPEVGVLLPCNVTVSVEEGKTIVRAINAETALGALGGQELVEVATEVSAALQRVIGALPS